MHPLNTILALAPLLHSISATAIPTTTETTTTLHPRQNIGVYPAPNTNNYTCKSAAHPNPVILLHGLGANKDEDLNVLETHLESLGFCTFALTYGAHPLFDFFGGLLPIAQSAQEIAAFIHAVQQRTGAAKVDLVAHSEGAFQALYVPKFESGVSAIVERIVSIAPPTHGTTFGGLYDLAYVAGYVSRGLVGTILSVVGCPACDDLGPNGTAVARLNDGRPIVQGGNSVTVVISRSDEAVTPVDNARVDEAGVRNVYVQDGCPGDGVGHIGEAYDSYVWSLVVNALDERIPVGPCSQGLPY